VDQDTFVLCIQAPFQMEAFWRLGNRFIGIDTTHNITQYKEMLLFTIMARDNWGHGEKSIIILVREALIFQIGVSVAWMLTTHGTTSTIKFFLNWVKEASPIVQPIIFMTDCDQAQITTIEAVYSKTKTLLCLWHVLRAIRFHFVTEKSSAKNPFAFFLLI
jgi:MULE transposase domain